MISRRGNGGRRGGGRSKHSRPTPSPEVFELACRRLGGHEKSDRLPTPAERAALWRDDRQWPVVDRVIDDSRDGIYGYQPDER